MIAAFIWLSLSSLAAKDLADYRLGDLAESDIATPVPLEVADTEANEVLKANEIRRGLAVFCYYPGWTAEAEAALRSAFAGARGNFLSAVEMVFRRSELDSREISSARFDELVDAFQKQNEFFPVFKTLAARWACGESDQDIESRFLAQLREAMAAPVRSEYVPPGLRIGATVRLLTVTNKITPTVEMAASHGANLPRTNLHSLARSKRRLQEQFPSGEARAAQFVAGLIKPNCFVDAELTRSLQLRNVEALWMGDRYKAGQTVVKKGGVIDKKIMAALDQLRDKTAASQIKQAEQTRKPARLLVAGFSAGFVISIASIIVVWRLSRRGKPSLAPERYGGDQEVPVPAGGSNAAWRRRALSAEKRAEKANDVIRKGLLPHLAHWMSDAVIQRLILQRSHLLETQGKTASEMEALGERLETIHKRMQDRLIAYEMKIAELEKNLDEKDEVNRELIRSEIALIKRQLEAEQVDSQVEYN